MARTWHHRDLCHNHRDPHPGYHHRSPQPYNCNHYLILPGHCEKKISPILPQLAKTPMYPSLVAIALRCKRWPCSSSSSFQRDPQPQRPSCAAPGADGLPPTSSTEFLLLAMACAGAHGRAAALACETSGIHPGLRTLDGGLVVLGRRLRDGGRRAGGFGVSREGDASSSEGVAGWFEPWLTRLRETALRVFEEDVLD